MPRDKRTMSLERASKIKCRRRDLYKEVSIHKKEALLLQRQTSNLESKTHSSACYNNEKELSCTLAAEFPGYKTLTIRESSCVNEKANTALTDTSSVTPSKGKNIVTANFCISEVGSTSAATDELPTAEATNKGSTSAILEAHTSEATTIKAKVATVRGLHSEHNFNDKRTKFGPSSTFEKGTYGCFEAWRTKQFQHWKTNFFTSFLYWWTTRYATTVHGCYFIGAIFCYLLYLFRPLGGSVLSFTSSYNKKWTHLSSSRVGLPDIKAREEILKVHSDNKKLDKDVSLSLSAMRTTGFSGADLANRMNEAAIPAGRRGKENITSKR